jgi:hypothetical protein
MERYLDIDDKGIKNSLTFFLLDRNIIRAIKMVALNPDVAMLFHDTIRKQLSMKCETSDYNASVGGLFTRTTMELYAMGREFQHRQ